MNALRPRLSRSELCFLARRAEAGDRAARQEIIRRNTPLVISIVAGFSLRSSDERDDLVQAGMVGLISAVDGFDWRRGRAFSTYATPWIRGEVIRALHVQRKFVSIPDKWLGLRGRIAEFAEHVEASAGRQPSIAEISAGLNVPSEVVIGVVGAARQVSFDDPESDIRVVDTGASYDAYARVELRLLLISAAGELSSREQEIIRRRYIDEQSINEIAAATQLSPRSVYVARDSALTKLRRLAGDDSGVTAA